MDELGVARAIAAGDLPSPQRYANIWLYAIRITGTGASYRQGLNEYVWRDKKYYLTDDFLARCNGLPVILEHPDKQMLDGEEFRERVVGAVMLAFIRDDEVWAVARIYDEAAAVLLREEQLSTSPAVVFRRGDPGATTDLGDGSHLLIEGEPALLDHIAICANGVWDKGGPPSGIDTTATQGDADMAEKDAAREHERHDAETEEEREEKRERDDSARRDSDRDIMTKLDSIAASLDSAHKRMDALEARNRKDADEEDEDERKDARRRDESEAEEEHEEEEENRSDRSRRDARRKDTSLEKWAEEEEKEPAHRGDAESEKERDADLEKGAKKAEKKLEEEERHDAETEEERMALKKANEARKDAAARADAALTRENADLRRRLASIEGTVRELTRETPPEERDALAAAQARADGVAALFGERVPAPLPGETSLGYRRKLLQRFIKHSPQMKDSRLDGLNGAGLDLIERQVYADATAAARDVAEGRPGLLVPMVSTDAAGRRITKYVGDPMAWMGAFMRGGQVCAIRQDRLR